MTFPRRVAALTCAALLVATPAFAAAYPDPVVQQTFQVPGADVTALVLDPNGSALVSVAPTSSLPPASTTKLFTVGTALALLGSDHRFSTRVEVTTDQDLVLVGAGDPTLTRRNLKALAQQVASAGITELTGELRIDDSLFDRSRGGFGWRGSYVGYEAGPLSALMVDHNLWRHEPAYKKDPLPATLALWRADLKAVGVTVDGPAAEGASPSIVDRVVATHASAPLLRIATHALQRSDNTEAEMLLKSVAVAAGVQGSSGAGASVIAGLAASWGVTLHGRLVDGSGLSRADRMDATSTVAWLQALDAHGLGAAMRTALPVSCRSGTLEERLCGSWLSGRVTAKTGTLDYTAALAGWARTRSGGMVVFAVIVDGPRDVRDRRAIDRAMTMLLRSKNL